MADEQSKLELSPANIVDGEIAERVATPIVTTSDAPMQPIEDAGPIGILVLLRDAIARGDHQMCLTLEGMHTRAVQWQAKLAFDEAKAGFQAECPAIPRRGLSKFDSATIDEHGRRTTRPGKYATLPDIIGTCTDSLTKHGLSLSFRPGLDHSGRDAQFAILSRGGYTDEVSMPVIENPPTDRSPKHFVYASAVRYAQRLAALAILGIPDDELDPEDIASTVELRDSAAISIDEASLIEEGLAELQPEDRAALMKWLKVDRVGDIPYDKFQPAMDAIARKKFAK